MTPEEIRSARQAAGLSRAELALKIGVSERSVYRWETGETRPFLAVERLLREALESASKPRRRR